MESKIDEIARALIAWGDDPGAFVRDALGVSPEPWQAEVLACIAGGERRVAVRSGHGVGKTALEAWLVLWFGMTREAAKIPATAPTAHQLNDLLWGEIAKWRRALAERLPLLAEGIEITSDRVEFRSWRGTAFARTSRREQTETLQGFHAEHLMFVIDDSNRRLVGVQSAIEIRGDAATEQHARTSWALERIAAATPIADAPPIERTSTAMLPPRKIKELR